MNYKETYDIVKLIKSELKFHAITLTLPSIVKTGTEEVEIVYLKEGVKKTITFHRMSEMITILVTTEVNEIVDIISEYIRLHLESGYQTI